MASIIRRLFTNKGQNEGQTSTAKRPAEDEEEVTLDDDPDSEWLYIANSIYYLAIILLIGVPMWCYTCSSTRYALPDLTQLEGKLAPPGPRLNLDVSVIQLGAGQLNNRDLDKENQLEYLRTNLPEQIESSVEGLTYNLNWRIRRPTQEEALVARTLLKENEKPPATIEQRQAIYAKLEDSLLRVHKSSNRFRLFMYIFDGPSSALVCKEPHSYLLNFERFVYICPGESNESVANLIRSALHETYQETVDPQRVKKILGAKTDLLVSLIPETDTISLGELSLIADKVHKIHDKNVKSKYLEVAGILNIRLITQNTNLIHQSDTLDKMFAKKVANKEAQVNSTVGTPAVSKRVLETTEMGRFFHDYESRLNKHSSQNVHHVATLIPDPAKPEIVLSSASEANSVNILEERDTNFILVGADDKSLVLGMRAVVRRVIGLKSANLCTNCLIKRDVFINKWELDAIVGALTILKLQSVLVSLRSISQQAIGIKIPKYVSNMVFQAHSLALESLDNLCTSEPLDSYHAISTAHELSESAFYDPSLLETLYFPDETKYAIYLPLFMPLGFPLALSILRIGKYFLSGYLPLAGRRKEKSS